MESRHAAFWMVALLAMTGSSACDSPADLDERGVSATVLFDRWSTDTGEPLARAHMELTNSTHRQQFVDYCDSQVAAVVHRREGGRWTFHSKVGCIGAEDDTPWMVPAGETRFTTLSFEQGGWYRVLFLASDFPDCLMTSTLPQDEKCEDGIVVVATTPFSIPAFAGV